jgi:hypothetical protein
MRTALGAEQQRLTDALTALARQAQDNDWFTHDLDPAAIAVFIQAYTLGKAVDDVAPRHVDQQAWEHLVNTIIATVFMGRPDLCPRDVLIPPQASDRSRSSYDARVAPAP